jgi:predicted nucleic acid-binding protein
VTVVVDTSILVDVLRGDATAVAALRGAFDGGEAVVGSVLTRTEVRAGMRRAERRRTELLLDQIDWVPVDVGIADAAGEFAAEFLRSHRGVDTTDYVIAATAVSVGGVLWTRNRKHFPMINDLRDPYVGEQP